MKEEKKKKCGNLLQKLFLSLHYLQLVFANKLTLKRNVCISLLRIGFSNIFQSKSFKTVFMFVVQRVFFSWNEIIFFFAYIVFKDLLGLRD